MVRSSRRLNAFRAFLISTTGIVALASVALAQEQAAQQAATFDIPAQSLSDSLATFARISGMRIAYPTQLTQGRVAPAVRGSLTQAQALERILTGSGLAYRLTGDSAVTVYDPAAAPASGAMLPDDGSLVLDTITVNGPSGQTSVYSPYETAAATSFISAEQIERFRGSSPSDIFRGTPGVLSGNSRNSAGAIDVNVRGLQGMGRVRVTVDDAENAVTIYQGYQGQSNRTYIDPDLIAGIDIQKGGDAASRGMAGTVAMRTLSASDIVKDGDKWAVRVKGGFGTNTVSPTDGATAGYTFYNLASEAPIQSSTGMDRPAFLTPTNGSGSVVVAYKEDQWDFLAGYAYRDQGNYFAGKNGGDGVYANPVVATVYDSDRNPYDVWANGGYTNYRQGEEVLNTSLQTQSFLMKGNLRFGENDEHSLQYTYNNYRGESGYLIPIFGANTTAKQNAYGATTGTRLDSGTLRYRYNPEDNDLVDLKVTGWMTYFQLLNDARLVTNADQLPESIGLAANYRTGTNTLMWGGDIANLSKLSSDRWGDLDVTYGASYIGQEVTLGRYADFMSFSTPSQGERDEVSGFAKAAYKPFDWLSLNAGLRYSHYSADGPSFYETGPAPEAGGWSPTVGVTVQPLDGVQLYANYGSTLRLPSLVETIGLFTEIDPNLTPERLNSIDLGVNLTRDGVFAGNDRGMVKLGWFNWDVKDYISRATQVEDDSVTLYIHNIDRAKFSGFELSGRYEIGGFTAQLSGNYYTDVEYCVTADTCGNMSLYGDYATNHVPPEYMLDLTLTQKFLEDRLTIGGRAYHVGPRAAGHGSVTATGASQFITPILWNPYTLFDVFAEYKINDNYTASIRVENLTDQFYVDPLGSIPQPGPGRTFYASLTGTFGGDQPLLRPSSANDDKRPAVDWTGFYAGFQGGYSQARTKGTTSVLDASADDFGGLADGIAASESADLGFSGGQIGLQAGYNWQLKNGIVLGVEADWSKSWAKGQQENAAVDDDVVAAGGWLQSINHHEIDWTGALRGRLGYAFDSGLMLYGTAGVSLLKENVARDQYFVTRTLDNSVLANYSGVLKWVDEDSDTRVGGTIGVGGEYAINDRWSLKAEYTYSRFGSTDYKFDGARAGTYKDYLTRELVGYTPVETPIYQTTEHEGGYDTVNGRKASNSLDLHSVKVGLNYRF